MVGPNQRFEFEKRAFIDLTFDSTVSAWILVTSGEPIVAHCLRMASSRVFTIVLGAQLRTVEEQQKTCELCLDILRNRTVSSR